MGDVRKGNTATHAENTAIASLELSKLVFFQACASWLYSKRAASLNTYILFPLGLNMQTFSFI